MAKEKETRKTIGLMDVNEDNFEQSLDNAGKFGEDVIALATENAEKEEKERKAREFNSIKNKAAYQKMRIVGDCQYAKKSMEIQKECMHKVDELFEKVAKGEIDAVDFDKAREEAIDEAVKKINELGKKRRTNLEKLRNAYPNHWSYSWDNPFARLNRAIEDNKRS